MPYHNLKPKKKLKQMNNSVVKKQILINIKMILNEVYKILLVGFLISFLVSIFYIITNNSVDLYFRDYTIAVFCFVITIFILKKIIVCLENKIKSYQN